MFDIADADRPPIEISEVLYWRLRLRVGAPKIAKLIEQQIEAVLDQPELAAQIVEKIRASQAA